MEQTFKCGKMDRRARRITIVSTMVSAIALGLACYFWGERGYAIAWFVSLAVAVGALFAISIPRVIRVTDDNIEIRCIVEVTYIPLSELHGIRRVGRDELNGMICIAGSYGLFGYFGVYLDLKRRELVRLYCKERDNIVELTATSGKRYYVSCFHADKLVACVTETAQPDN